MPLIADAGLRDKLVTIQQRPSADAVDGGGYPTDGPWTTLGTEHMYKADATDLGQSERFTAEQLSASFDTEWQMPYRSTMDPEALDVPKLRRLVFRGRYYDIVHAKLMQAHEGRMIVLRTLAASGVTA